MVALLRFFVTYILGLCFLLFILCIVGVVFWGW